MQNDYAWNTGSDVMPCADMPEYPTADEILALARHIAEYFLEYTEDDIKEPPTEMPFAVTPEFPAPVPAIDQSATGVPAP